MNNYNNTGTIKILFLVSCILNILTSLSWIFLTVIAAISFLPLGCGAALVLFLSAAAGIYDFICYNRLNKKNRTGTHRTIKIAAVLDIIAVISLNITSVVFGFIILNMLSKPETKQELTEQGIF